MRLDYERMLLNVRSHVHQLVQVLVYHILKHVFAVWIFLVETWQHVLPTDLFFKRRSWEASLRLVIVSCVLFVRFLQRLRVEQLFLLILVWVYPCSLFLLLLGEAGAKLTGVVEEFLLQ